LVEGVEGHTTQLLVASMELGAAYNGGDDEVWPGARVWAARAEEPERGRA
jgi:hypothetical protein